MGVFIQSGEKLTPEGLAEAAKWKAFKKHLGEYNITKKYPIDSIVLWEQYLVYGTVLGISQKVLEQFLVSIPAEEQAQVASVWGGGSGVISSGGLHDSISGITEAIASINNSSTTAYGAAGVGSSGGASGGGGGGGGSGGGGAG